MTAAEGLTTLRGFRALPKEQRYVAMQAAVWLPMFHLAISVLGVRRFSRFLALPGAERVTHSAVTPDVTADIVVRVAARIPRLATCLTRALYLRWLLRRQGIAAELRIGVDVSSGNLAAHAWVEGNGRALGERPESLARYAAFDCHI